ncbi:MAG TPA: alanine racemase [bacterium]|nr:alanine racemase [bacterium]
MSERALRAGWAEIDLDAIQHNVRALRGVLVPPAQLMVVVKANAYGHGAVEVARAAAAAGAWGFGVATADEGEELRRAGRREPVVLLDLTLPDEAGRIVANDLAVGVADLDAARALSRAAEESGRAARLHLKIDTGMGRAGCSAADAPSLAAAVARLPGVALEGCYTHFPAADDRDLAPTREQTAAFAGVVASLREAGLAREGGSRLRRAGQGGGLLCHAANSAATLALPEAHFDLVRCGIAVYGIAPAPHLGGRVPLRPAMRLCARVVQAKRVAAGTTVGYGREYRAPRETTIATVPLGYADGYPRLAWPSAAVALAGRRVPLAGRISMDQLTVDAGEIQIRKGDEVELWGPALPVEEVAAAAQTIPWELLVRVAARVPRVFTSGGAARSVRTLVAAWDASAAASEGRGRRARRLSGRAGR